MVQNENIKAVEVWLKDLSASLKTEIALDDDGICSFQIEEGKIITLEVSSERSYVYLYSPLIALPIEDEKSASSLMMRSLELNAFQLETRGGTIALVPGRGLFVFCFTVPIEGTDSDIFNKTIGEFLVTTDEIKKLLSESIAPSG